MLTAAVFLAVSAGVTFAAPAPSGGSNTPDADQQGVVNPYKIDLALAPIKSESDLVNYMGNMPKNSPLRMLSDAGRASFIQSLVFGNKGLGSFNYAVLQNELTPTQIYRVLSLFGMQRTTSLITGAAVTNAADKTIMATPDRYAVPKGGAGVSSPRHDPVQKAFALFQGDNTASFTRSDTAYDSEARARFVNDAYQARLGRFQNPGALGKLSTRDVNLLWHAALEAFSAGTRKTVLHDAELDVKELRKRGKVTPLIRNYMVKSYIKARDFQRANKILAESGYTGSLLPVIRRADGYDDHRPSIMRTDSSKNEVRVENVDLRKYDVIVVATPQCHFVSRAMSDIGKRPDLQSVFAHSLWVMPQDGSYDPGFMQRWNRTHTIMKMVPVYDERSWPMITYWGTPTFYVLRDGKVVRRIVGWPAGGNGKALVAAMHDAGHL